MLRNLYIILVIIISTIHPIALCSQPARGSQAKWISTQENQNATNTWLAYRKTFEMNTSHNKAIAKIAVDSKYWLWINDSLIVFEGGLKRGPDPVNSYVDTVSLAPFLKQGKNTIAILVWYFGKDGFSHNGSGKAGLLFECKDIKLISDKTWKCSVLKEYKTAGEPYANFRLSESSILYDAQVGRSDWYKSTYNDSEMANALELGVEGDYPWNLLVERPIPQWKNSGLRKYENPLKFPFISSSDTIVCTLPYNAHVTPYFKINARAGQKIIIFTDNYSLYNGAATNLRCEYITKDGLQEYENYSWVNGHRMFYVIPKGIEVIELKYRETGYNAEFAGSFTSSDPFLNSLWKKAQRTLYVTMRDTYMDCPDRERAQWTGDAATESGEVFYALSTSGHQLTRKWLYELINWQRSDGSLFSPTPSANWNKELPCQVLATVGYYGLWNYYMHTGDKKILTDLYPQIQRYLQLWEEDGKGTMVLRKGDWTWGDWGDEKDMRLLYNLWYYLAIKGMHAVAIELQKPDDASRYENFMKTFKESFNKQFWNGEAYRDPQYQGKTDDRTQALAVLAGIADRDKYPALLKVFLVEEHASPYMEKYVFEAMFLMGYEVEALARHQKRFSPMVNNKYFTTLFEGWGIGKEGFGGGTVNHAWSGGGLTILSQYLCGVAPTSPGYETFQVLPQPGNIEHASTSLQSVKGEIKSEFRNVNGTFLLSVQIPPKTKAAVGVPNKGVNQIKMNNKLVWKNGEYTAAGKDLAVTGNLSHISFNLPPGTWKLTAR